jgi:hypothetical protein
MSSGSRERFFYIGPGGRNQDGGTNCTLCVVAAHYSKSVTAANELLETLRQKLCQHNIEFTDKGPDAANLSFGIATWNRGQLQLSLDVALKMSCNEVDAAFQAAGFVKGHPDSQ